MGVRAVHIAPMLLHGSPPTPIPPAGLEPQEASPPELAKRLELDRKRSSIGALEIDAPHVLTWRDMPQEARAAAGAAALFVRWALPAGKRSDNDDVLFRYDPRVRVAFAVKPASFLDTTMNPPRVCFIDGEPPQVSARAVPRTVEATLVAVRAAFGHEQAADLQRFIRRRS